MASDIVLVGLNQTYCLPFRLFLALHFFYCRPLLSVEHLFFYRLSQTKQLFQPCQNREIYEVAAVRNKLRFLLLV